MACSCTTGRLGCYKGLTPSVELQIAAEPSASSLRFPETRAVSNLSVKSVARLAMHQEALPIVKEKEAIEMPLGMEPRTETLKITSMMADSLRAVASTVDNRFARRIINRTANRIEKIAVESKPRFIDKMKAKIQSKFFMRAEERSAAMAGSDILAIVSLSTGIFSFAYYAFPLGVVAIVTGAIALRRGTGRRGMAIAGIVLGAIGLAFWSGFFII